jgi:hypothetical protein
MIQKSIYLLFILFVTNAFAQEITRTKLSGKINANLNDLEGIYVVNLKTEKSVITDKGGYFSIDASSGDVLLFSSIQLKGVQMELLPEHFKPELVFVKMEIMINQLPEVMIRRYDNINAVALGIVPAGIKQYSPAERKYARATSGRLNPMGLDPLLNMLSGRSAMLKKELEVEKKEIYLQQLDNMFERNHFIEDLKIPKEYVKGFQYYIVENERFTTILNSKNKITTDFLMGELAIKYNNIIACENE